MAAPNPSYSSSAAVTIRLSSDGKNYKDRIKQLTNYAATENAVAVLDGPARLQLYRLVHHDVLREIAMVLRFVRDALEPAPTELGFFGNSPTFGHVRLLHWRCRVAVTTSIHHFQRIFVRRHLAVDAINLGELELSKSDFYLHMTHPIHQL
jgi:hypothetical protein